VSGGLPPYKLQRTTVYIQAHLEEKLSLATLAAVAEMSATHFAHLFKQATGLTPHQYVSLCRIAHAKRLLAETDCALIEIGAQVGCTDHSHFAALFRRYVSMPPKPTATPPGVRDGRRNEGQAHQRHYKVFASARTETSPCIFGNVDIPGLPSAGTRKEARLWAGDHTTGRTAMRPCRSSAAACWIAHGSRPQ
jgi:AraC-like DNA-binding protein